ncbi:uncharacterized protein DMAD_06109 [Drosophila madeirensis]|uniref:Uncharacterized protein n=1 Tax=Drosophila madeirensis TaxID=30013 RepID=A0AAU9FP98_DROMD
MSDLNRSISNSSTCTNGLEDCEDLSCTSVVESKCNVVAVPASSTQQGSVNRHNRDPLPARKEERQWPIDAAPNNNRVHRQLEVRVASYTPTSADSEDSAWAACAAALAATDFTLTDGADCNKLKKRKKSAVGKAKARKSLCRRATKRATKPKKRLTKPKNKINARTKAKKAAKKCAPAKKKN